MKVTTLSSSAAPALFAIPVGSPGFGATGTPVVTTKMPTRHDHEGHRGRWYAAIFLTAATLVLIAMGVWQYVGTQTTPVTTTVATAPMQIEGVSIPQAMRLSDAVVSGVPVKYAGVSIPQAMRLSDAVVSGVPVKYAGVSIPQAMRLSDAVVSGVPAEYAGVSIPQAMRLSDAVVSGVPAEYAGVSIPQAMRLSDAAA